MTENSNHASGSYFFACYDEEHDCSPETVFLRIDDESLTPFLLGFLKKIYGGREGNPIFHAQAVDGTDQAQRSSRDKAIRDLAAGSQDPWPPRETMLRASYAQMAKSWVKVRRSREANDSDQTPVEQLEASLQKLEEATSALSYDPEKGGFNPEPELTTYRQALCDAEAHVDGISAYLDGPQSGQIETGLHDTLDSLSRAVEHVISGDKVRPDIYQLPSEIIGPVRKAFDYFSRIYTELSQSGFQPGSDLFENFTAAESHVDTPEGCWPSEEEREAAQQARREQRQMERLKWVRIWVERQGESEKAWLTGEVIHYLRALARSIQHWASGLDSAVRDLLRCDDDGAFRRGIIHQIVERHRAARPMFLTVPFKNRDLSPKTMELNQEHHKGWEELFSRLEDLEKKRKLLRDKVVEEVRQWNENNHLHSCPHLILESSCLQGTAEDCIKRIYNFVDVLRRESNRGSMGSPAVPSPSTEIAGSPEQKARDETSAPPLVGESAERIAEEMEDPSETSAPPVVGESAEKISGIDCVAIQKVFTNKLGFASTIRSRLQKGKKRKDRPIVKLIGKGTSKSGQLVDIYDYKVVTNILWEEYKERAVPSLTTKKELRDKLKKACRTFTVS